MRREDKIPLLGTDPPWSPEVLLDGRHAQPDVHLKGARWYLTRSRTRALLPCSLFPGGKPAGFNPLPHQPKVRARLRSLGFFVALSAGVCRRDPGSSFWRGGLCTGRARSSPRATGESSGSGPKMRACPPASQLGFPWSNRSAGRERA